MQTEKTKDLQKVLKKLKNVLLSDTRTAIEYDEKNVVVIIENLNNMQQKERIFAIHNKDTKDGLQITFNSNEKLRINENDTDVFCNIVNKYVTSKEFVHLNKLIRFANNVFSNLEVKFKSLKTANTSNFDPITQLQDDTYYYINKDGGSTCLKLKSEGSYKIASYALTNEHHFKSCFIYVPPQTYNGKNCTIIDPANNSNIDTDNIFKTLLNAE